MEEQNIIFSYFCMNAFCLVTTVKIFDKAKDNILLSDLGLSEELQTLPYGAIQEILSALKQHKDIFSFAPDEIEKAIQEDLKAENLMILDEYWIETVYFSDTVHEVKFNIKNLTSGKNQLIVIKRLMNEIRAILSAYGMDEIYF